MRRKKMKKTELSVRYMWCSMKKKFNICIIEDPGRKKRD